MQLRLHKFRPQLKQVVGLASVAMATTIFISPLLLFIAPTSSSGSTQADSEPPSQRLAVLTSTPTPTIESPPEPTPEPTATPTPTPPPLTWRDNPQHCDTATQWIAKDPPFVCIDKFSQPTKQPSKVATTKRVASAAINYGGAYTSLPGVAAALLAPYISGGTSLAGFDCSGLTQYLSRLRGYNVPRTASGQINALRHISMAEARAGDIIGFNYGHVGMYLGGGKVIHALNPSQGVRITTMDDAIAFNGFVTALAVGH